ncbi:hypothetical protein BGZ93_009615 [Podila epicladia]|nr:hypothetical protein BGZ93_009615 [Podila epicladia]
MNLRSPVTLSSLPNEIFDAIFDYVPQRDIVQCVLVSQTCLTHLTRYVWRTIDITSPVQLTLFHASIVQQALTRNAGHVHSLSITYQCLCAIFLPEFNTPDPFPCGPRHHNTTPLDFRKRNAKLYNRFVSLVQQQTSALSELVLDVPFSSELLLKLVNEDLPHLQHLELRAGASGSELDLKRLLKHLPKSIRTIFVSKGDIWRPRIGDDDDNSTAQSTNTHPTIKHHHALKLLHLVADLKGAEEYALLPFLESCSNNLKVFSGTMRTGCFQNKNIAAVLARLGIYLDRLELGDLPQGCNSYDRDIADMISLSDQWSDLSTLGLLGGVGCWVMAAVQSNCHQLETLDLGRGAKIMGAHVRSILSRARCLKSIRIDPTTLIVMASDLVASEWATTSLRVLAMRIDLGQGYSEQSNHVSLAEVNITTPFASCPLQCQLFRHIGTQTMLQELILGGSRDEKGEREINCEGKCLDVTLASGLDELAGLKELAALDLGDLSHTMGIVELEWIHRQWRSLRRLKGVIRSWKPQPGAQKWIRKRRMQRRTSDEVVMRPRRSRPS